MDLKEIVKEAILTYAISLTNEKFQELPPDRKVEEIIKINHNLRALAENSTSEPDKALGLFGVSNNEGSVCPYDRNPKNCNRRADTCFKCVPIK